MTRARIQHKNGALAPNFSKGCNYWERVRNEYPHQVEVTYMSSQDMDPRKVARLITFDFKRVVCEGSTFFGFTEEKHLDQFKKEVGL